MGNLNDKKDELKSVGGETIAVIKNEDCLTIACCDCKLTHRFIVTLRRIIAKQPGPIPSESV